MNVEKSHNLLFAPVTNRCDYNSITVEHCASPHSRELQLNFEFIIARVLISIPHTYLSSLVVEIASLRVQLSCSLCALIANSKCTK